MEDELRAPHAVGNVVYMKTFSAGGEPHFRAEVLAVQDIFPPVQVKFLSTLAGDTNHHGWISRTGSVFSDPGKRVRQGVYTGEPDAPRAAARWPAGCTPS